MKLITTIIFFTFAPLTFAAPAFGPALDADKPIAHIVSTAAQIENATVDKNFTIEWWQFIDSAKEAQPILTIADNQIGLRPPPKGMVQNPPRLAIFAGETVRTKVFAYPGKWHHLALIARDNSAQFFINGQPDGDSFDAANLTGKLNFQRPTTAKVTEVALFDHALPDDRIQAHFKSAIRPHEVTTCGHRGDNTGCPENTNISYVTAVAMHVPVVEMDLRLTKDNTLILLHDATVDRTTTSKGKIADMMLADAQKLDAGSKKDPKFQGEPLPTLQTIIGTCRGKAIMMLDLKLEDLAEPLADIKAKNNLKDDAWILAPWTDEHGIKLHKVLPHVPMIRLTGKVPTTQPNDAYFAHMKQLGFTGFSIAYPITPQSFIESAHKAGMNVWVWTVNEPSDVAGAVLLGADGIITDCIPPTTELVSRLTRAQN